MSSEQSFLSMILYWIVSAISLMLTAYFVPGFKVGNFSSALIAAVVIGALNMFVRPVLFFLTLPLNILTLGLFTFVLNAATLMMASALLPNFNVAGWGAAIWGGIILAIVSWLLHSFFI